MKTKHPSVKHMLSHEPEFTALDLSESERVVIPRRAGLLAFLYADKNQSETVLKFLMCEDLARSFRGNRPFTSRANRIAFCVFTDGHQMDFDAWKLELRTRLQRYAQLTEKYKVPQHVSELADFFATR